MTGPGAMRDGMPIGFIRMSYGSFVAASLGILSIGMIAPTVPLSAEVGEFPHQYA